jgi:hypothetical protein
MARIDKLEAACGRRLEAVRPMSRRLPPALEIAIPHKICHSHTETLGNPMEGAER